MVQGCYDKHEAQRFAEQHRKETGDAGSKKF
jgi:hypothetical protein